ncbi:hypothetical protein ATY75_29010 [Rhizobium sp. N122]|uniref:hypothetical protein n=1 Tax=Rhizobium sp. N122 TaxID=1764272 RepID=UPI000B5A7871|nr:hypothetical protein [Rhizobium sp. N122]OWV78054.1 hypothetical protein ATY75_29010 [Rhizobium sp. N122]
MSKEHFYVCIFMKDGVPTGHATSEANNFEIIETELSDEEVPTVSGFGEQFHLFQKAILSYMELLPVVASLLPTVSRGVQNSIGGEFLESHGTEILSAEDRKIFELPIGHRHEWAALNEQLAASSLVGKQVPKMLLIGIVSTFEHFQSRLFSEILKCKPQKYLLDDRTVTLADVTKYGSIDELKKNILERDVENIMRESFVNQIEKIESLLEIKNPIPPSYKDWNDLVEIFERRNLFAHADGRVNEIYLGRLKKERITSTAKSGDELVVKPAYLNRALMLICEFGTMSYQVAWRRCCPNEVAAADEALGELGYNLIERGHLSAAERILRFAKSLRGRDTSEQTLSDTINLANCYRLQKKKSECEAELALQNWKVLGPEFQICVASINGDITEVVRLMKVLYASKADFPIDNYERWAAFYGTRDHDDFKKAFKRMFGRDYIPAPSLKSAVTYIAKAKKQAAKEEQQASDSTRH